MEDKLIIARKTKRAIDFIEKNIYNISNDYKVLKESLYDILENVYRANINQEKKYKEEIIVQIKMLNYYLKKCMDLELITKSKFLSYGKYLLEIHDMVNSWMEYEKN